MKNQVNDNQNAQKIVITAGDESGVGPEVILKALFSKEIPKDIKITLVGSKINFEKTYQNLQALGIKDVANPNNYKITDIDLPFDENLTTKEDRIWALALINSGKSFFYSSKFLAHHHYTSDGNTWKGIA